MSTPKRPRVDREMIFKAAQEVMAEHADDIANEYDYPMDGFELCKKLDRWLGWDSTREDMDTLDGMDSAVRELLEAAEKEWFEQHNIQPPYAIGTKVNLGRGDTGEITGIYGRGHGKYLVKIDGHDDELCGYRRRIINFEDALPL